MSRGPDKQFDPEIALERAMEVFWKRGYEAASLSELLQNMGIGKKSLYDTFGNKRSLFVKALEHYAQTVIKSLRQQLSAPGSPLANLKGTLRELQRIHGMPNSNGCMFGTNIADFGNDDEEMARILRSYLKQLEDAFYDVIHRAQAAGELEKSTNPRDLARMLLCTQQGMALIGRVLDEERLLASAVNATIAILEES